MEPSKTLLFGFLSITTLSVVAACDDGTSTAATAAGGASASSGATQSTSASMSTSSSMTTTSSMGSSMSSNMSSTATGMMIECNEAGGPIPPLKLTSMGGGLVEPAFVTSAPMDPTRLYVLELDGRIQMLANGALAGTFLDITSIVHAHNGTEEWGLLGMAFHPQYPTNGRFFLYYTDKANKNHVAEFKRSAADPLKADPVPVKDFNLAISDNAYNHNGGMLAFGKDGLLYIAVGDTAPGPGPMNPAQDLASNLGKILRIDVDAHPTPPAGNVMQYVYDFGFRNPWRFSFDSCTGDMFIGDVGQQTHEEVDVHPTGLPSGMNFGWSVMEGAHCYGGGSGCDTSGKTLPITEYDHNDGVSITGGYVYRGKAIGGLQGVYLYGDFASRRVWALRYQGGAATAEQELTQDLGTESFAGLSSFGEDSEGNLYLVDIGGTVHRIDAE